MVQDRSCSSRPLHDQLTAPVEQVPQGNTAVRVSNAYSLSTGTQGSWRRCAASSSRSRLSSFSLASSASLAARHSSRLLVGCADPCRESCHR